ncbi:hypothetical protein [Pseudorhodoplanes sinuspersici]|uniref:Uncharacterized protein n=1 Tax=Pseudorhodoplanes sinuspersici TaxID=1235591 RepID=A0A1W6ZU14_9HYPH|nr:hypothetical protein [Pseudorhodoplanes sinuspersici]ARQ00822.1 hypothetical protein CAK95_18305 [Pseudorhodoplanes sinuspersici]RKE72440.1 hypothetical protein DFP91_0305 [Pseudorhodoplanes sinuspersici]
MRAAAILLSAIIFVSHDAGFAATPRVADFSSSDNVLTWINGYRHRPEPDRLPAAIQAMSRYGALRDPEGSGVYVGFISGVIGANPDRASALIEGAFPINTEDHWAIVRAIAHSGLPNWKQVLSEQSPHMPTRAVMIAKYFDGSLPTITATVPQPPLSASDKIKQFFSREKPKGPEVDWALDASPEVLDMLWGKYFATGDYGPILRIVGMLPWSKERDSVDKLTLGVMAKFTLATNSARNPELLALLKRSARHQPKETAEILKTIIDAADTMQLTALRKEAVGAIEDLKRKGPGSKRDVATAGKIGEGAIALGCLGAAVTGQVALGLPCVVGGAVTSAVLKGWTGQ